MSSTGLAFIGGLVVLLANKSWNEKDPDDLSKAIANEIWIDLKEKRFLNTVKPVPGAPAELQPQSSMQVKRGILSLLGWNKSARERKGYSSFSTYGSTSQHSGDNPSENPGSGDERGLRGTA
jgi:Rieske Fe-S protein